MEKWPDQVPHSSKLSYGYGRMRGEVRCALGGRDGLLGSRAVDPWQRRNAACLAGGVSLHSACGWHSSARQKAELVKLPKIILRRLKIILAING